MNVQEPRTVFRAVFRCGTYYGVIVTERLLNGGVGPRRINNIRAYIAHPEGDEKPNKAVILLSDIFGIFPNRQLVADAFAANGYLAVLPDLFNGDQVNIGDYDAKTIDVGAWLSRHTVDDVASIVEATIEHLRTVLYVQKVAAAGYCFGGKVRL
ncbi:protein AIM2 [Aspergillus udagawae]|nr:protein AIM2 [Aspergillus udagawae]